MTVIFLFSLIIFYKSTKNTAEQKVNSTQVPLILIPGTNGDGDQFDNFMNMITKKIGKRDILKINVKTDGTTEWTSSLTKKSIAPFIVISFSDSSEKGVEKQAEWTDIAMKKAHQLYSFNSYNALGYSNGGLVWTIYLEKMTQKSTSQMKNLITLGTPYN